MNAAQRILDAPTITTDLIAEILQCQPFEAVSLLARMMLGGLLLPGANGHTLTDKGRATLQIDANRATTPQDRAHPAPRIETEADVIRPPCSDWDADDDGRDL